MESAPERKYINSHVDWNLEKHTDKTSKALLTQLDIHLREHLEDFKIPALLFQAYIHAFYRKQGDEDPEEEKALAILKRTHDEIDKFLDKNCTCGDKCTKLCESAQGVVGFRIVCDTLTGKIYESSENKSEAQKSYRKVDRSLEETADLKVANAYINGTRAFAISRLGPSRMEESLLFFEKACEFTDTNTDWLYGKALLYGRITRQKNSGFGIPRKETQRTTNEKVIYDKILKINPGHNLAKLFKALVLFNEDKIGEAEKLFENLLKDEHKSLEVLNRSILFYREIGNLKRARELIEEAEKKVGVKDAFLYHQKALIFIEEYTHEKGKMGATESTTQLLRNALDALDEAKKVRDSPDFVKDRVWVHQELGEDDEAEKELKRILKRKQKLWDIDVIRIRILYGKLFLEKYSQMSSKDKTMEALSKGLDFLKQAIEMSCKNKDIKDAMVKHLCKADLENGLLKIIYDAILLFEKHNVQCIRQEQNVPEALGNIRWLKQILRNVPVIFQDTKSAEDYFEEAYVHHKQNTTNPDDVCFEHSKDFWVEEKCFDELKGTSEGKRFFKKDLITVEDQTTLQKDKGKKTCLTSKMFYLFLNFLLPEYSGIHLERTYYYWKIIIMPSIVA